MLSYLTLENVLAVVYLAILEAILSVDNALALAALVKGRLKNPIDQKHALRYGLIGAYLMRTVIIFCGVYLMSHMWVKAVAGIYLVWLAINELFLKKGLDEGESEVGGLKVKWLSPLWSAVVAVECMDLMFSIDSIAVTLSVSDKYYILILGAILGILMMRFAAGVFIGLIQRFPILEKTAFVLVFLAGMRIIGQLGNIHIPEIYYMSTMFSIIGVSLLIERKSSNVGT